jgi:hypothetical protein
VFHWSLSSELSRLLFSICVYPKEDLVGDCSVVCLHEAVEGTS